MLGEKTLRETRVRNSVPDINYESFNDRKKCCCNTPSLRPLCCYCFGVAFYAGSCVASFYAGYSYEKLNHHSSGSSES